MLIRARANIECTRPWGTFKEGSTRFFLFQAAIAFSSSEHPGKEKKPRALYSIYIILLFIFILPCSCLFLIRMRNNREKKQWTLEHKDQESNPL